MPPLPSIAVLAYLVVLAFLSLYGIHRLFIVATFWRTRKHQPPMNTPAVLPVVTVQLPIFNEANVVERLIDAACALDWPADRLEVQVLDDSTDETVLLAQRAVARWQARGVAAMHIHRTDRTGYKAGALAAGALVARGELLAVFDADFVPPRDFLRRVVPAFDGFEGDPTGGPRKVGMVQARWTHINEHQNLLTRLSAALLDGHFVLEHAARYRSGRFFNFNGTAGVWRRTCINDAGGWAHDTLTEDLDLSYRAQLRGWSFVYLPDVVVPAELPADTHGFKLQQHRWAKGTVQTARKLLVQVLRARIPLGVRAEAAVHLCSNFAYPLVLLMALLMPLAVAGRGHSGWLPALLLDLPAFLLATGSVGLFYALAGREAYGSLRGRLWQLPLVMALGIGMAVSQTRAVVEGLWGKDRTFLRTPKAGMGGSRRYRAPSDWTRGVELALGAYHLAAAGWAVRAGYWASVPFLLLFASGFLLVALHDLWGRSWGRSMHVDSLDAVLE
jgi:cellulose synthase/poly-beta-1,6-N-acetylglucosamine synthase-like glycosyltransferase